MNEQVEILKAVADDTRLRIMNLLLSADCDLCCCELTDSLKEPQYNVSKHLKILKQARMIDGRQEGRWVYYSLPGKPDPFRKALLEAIKSASQSPRARKDVKNLRARMSLRQGGKCTVGVLHEKARGGGSVC